MPRPMLYGSRLHGYTPYAQGLWSVLAEWIILRMAHKGKLANPFILFRAMNKFSCLILPIIHAYDTGISRLRSYAWPWWYAWLWSEDTTSIVCPTPIGIYDSSRISWLQLHFLTPIDVMTPVVSPDSDHASQLWPMSMPHVLPPQLWNTSHSRARWLQHLTTQTLSRKQTRRDAWLNQHSKPQYLTASHAQVVRPCAAWPMTLSLGWSERNSSIQKDSIPLQLRRINVFECLITRAKALCVWPWH
jgi:hypothetical protein